MITQATHRARLRQFERDTQWRAAKALAALLIVGLTQACAPMACVTAAALEAAPPVEVAGAPGLLVRMGRELLLAAARRGCESGAP